MSCHQTCQTCQSQLFTSCLTCPSNMVLLENTCQCQTNWQTQCVSEIQFRELFMFLDMFITLIMVGLMLMYTFRARLPVSYRIWSGLNSLSMLIYSPALYLEYQDFFSLKTLSHSNGPYLSLYRTFQITLQTTIFPTMIIFICLVCMFFMFYPVYQIFTEHHQNFLTYLQSACFKYFDTFYFLCSRMMFMSIGKAINQLSQGSDDITMPLIVAIIFGIICILGIVRTMILYHRQQNPVAFYSAPVYLYTILSPISMIALCLVNSQILLIIVYCAPLVLFLLILLLNRGEKIFTKSNSVIYIIQIIFIGISVGYILVDDEIKSYMIIGIDFISIFIIFFELIRLNYAGINISDVKVHPQDVPNYQKQNKKQIYGKKSDKDSFKETKSFSKKGEYI